MIADENDISGTLDELAPAPTETEAGLRQSIHTLCILVGPYRNLTTLTAAALSLHPRAMALNHAFPRLRRAGRVGFIEDDSDRALDHFMEAAIRLCQGGRRGRHGGAIMHAHAFDAVPLRQRYADRFGAAVLKPGGELLVWKDSMQVLNAINHAGGRFPVGGQRTRIRYVLPIRNPIDCARSNLDTVHYADFMPAEPVPSLHEVMTRILRIIAALMTGDALRQNILHPLWETDWDADGLTALATFLGIAPDPRWIADVLEVARPRPSRANDHERAIYRQVLEQVFPGDSPLKRRLAAFADPVA